MGDVPLVSVIVPTHNCGAYIGEAISSVLAQTYAAYEFIVVDDGSTDNTRAVLTPYWGRIQYLYQDSQGVAAARNAGIRHAQGELVAFLDADDVWFPTKLELQVQAFRGHTESGAAFTDFLDFDESGVTRRSRLNTQRDARAWFERHRVGDSEIACGSIYQDLLLANWVHTSSVVVKREVLSVVGVFDETFTIGEDLDLWLRIARRYSVLCVNRVLSGYRYWSQSLSGPMEYRAVRYNQGIQRVLEKHLANNSMPPVLKDLVTRELGQRCWAIGWNLFGQDRFTEARSLFRQGMRYYPFHTRLWLYWMATWLPLAIIEAIRRMISWGRALQCRTEAVPQ